VEGHARAPEPVRRPARSCGRATPRTGSP
jgi:hypothetical protein